MTILAEHSDAIMAAVRAQIPNCLFGIKDLGDGQLNLRLTVYALTGEQVQEALASIGADQLAVKSIPASAPSLSDLVQRAKAGEMTAQPGQ